MMKVYLLIWAVGAAVILSRGEDDHEGMEFDYYSYEGNFSLSEEDYQDWPAPSNHSHFSSAETEAEEIYNSEVEEEFSQTYQPEIRDEHDPSHFSSAAELSPPHLLYVLLVLFVLA